MNDADYTLRLAAGPADIAATAWNALLHASAAPTPFMRHEYLRALDASASAVAESGWQPLFPTLWRGDELVAACPAYLKTHSWGEYVFDWAWADAYRRHGLDYYPKLLVAVPFTPVPGSRLLARDAAARAQLVAALGAIARANELSSIHVLFGDAADQAALADAGWLARSGVQFHWQRPATDAPADFTEFLATLTRDKRKKIQQEQRRVRDAGVVFDALEGAAISPDDWDFFYRCYTLTYQAHRSTPYLTREFFAAMAADLPAHWLMFMARRGDERVACSLVALDPATGQAYGRYWGAVEQVPCLHFDACYYQPLAWCLANGYRRFEGGAQGEHKMARGLLPVPTHSAHWLAHPQFRAAVGDFLAREGLAIDAYVNELAEHQPFKTMASPPGDA